MKICLIGGIYGAGGQRSEYVKVTPETTLETGFRAAGHEVTTLSHYDAADFSRFDVVHVHHLSYGAARLASDPSGVPFVFTAHDASVMSGARLSPIRKAAARYVYSRADAVVSLTRLESKFLAKRYPLEGALQAAIPNGIDPSQFPCIRSNAGDGRPWKLLFVGQLIPLKGCDLLLRTLARLPKRFTLTLAYQTARLEPELKALARSLGIASRVKFLGKQDPSQLAALYQSSDLLVLPSATEALPSVITEAMLSGLPFVASSVGGIPEQAGGFGELLKQRTEDALAAAIHRVLKRYDEYAQTAYDMSAYASDTFSIEHMVDRHLELYESLQGSPARRNALSRVFPDAIIRAAVQHRGTPRGSRVGATPAAVERI